MIKTRGFLTFLLSSWAAFDPVKSLRRDAHYENAPEGISLRFVLDQHRLYAYLDLLRSPQTAHSTG
jgi:hypothetical protein